MELQWPLILFTTFIAWSAGTFGAQAVYALRGKADKAQVPALIVTLVLMAIGGIAVFFHLGHWERIFNGFGHITSGITQELIMIVLMVIVMVIYFVFLRRKADDEKLPAWIAILAIVVAAVLCIVMAHSYLMAARPGWNNIWQICSIIGAACGLGPATMAVIAAVTKENSELDGKANIIGTAVNALGTVIYVFALNAASSGYVTVSQWFDPTSPTRDVAAVGVYTPFSGDALTFTILAIVCAVVALCVAFFAKGKDNWKVWGSVIAILVAAGAIFLRVLFYMMGGTVYPFF